MVGAGLHTTQTVGLALATDLAPTEAQPKVVALLCVMLLVGMVGSAVVFGLLLARFSELRLIQVVQGSAVVTMVLNGIALWKQEPRRPSQTLPGIVRPGFRRSWQTLNAAPQSMRRLVAVGLGTVGFSMQDVLLEPYGGQILHLPVGTTTALTALLAVGGLIGLGTAARLLGRGHDPHRVAALGAMIGLAAFACVAFAAPVDSAVMFGAGVGLIGLGGGFFAHGTLTAAMRLAQAGQTGLAIGTWGAVQASAAGLAVASGGLLRDGVAALASAGHFGPTLDDPATGYGAVYTVEVALLFATLIAIGPLVRAGTVSARSFDYRTQPLLQTRS